MRSIKATVILTALITLFSCSGNQDRSANSSGYKQYEDVFKELETLLQAENGAFWGHDLYGPLLFVDPETRAIVANRNNAENTFTRKGKVFTDTIPEEINLANTVITWNNERWTMVMLPLPENVQDRDQLLVHELFHRVQPLIGFDSLNYGSNSHLDSYEGRLLLRLELEALRKALLSDVPEITSQHITNALSFRTIRQNDEDIKEEENSLEILEGLAEYTGLMLSGREDADIRKHLAANIDAFYTNSTFIRSFPYQTVPIYGYLLSCREENWQKKVTRHTNLTDFFRQVFNFHQDTTLTYESLALENDYSFQELVGQEQERENKRLAILAEYRKMFLEDPALTLPFRNMNISFDPRNLMPLDDRGTVYPNLRVSDAWGILTVEEGAMISSDWSGVTVSAPINIGDQKIEGRGWILELNKGWKLVEKEGIYTLGQD